MDASWLLLSGEACDISETNSGKGGREQIPSIVLEEMLLQNEVEVSNGDSSTACD